MLAQWFEKWRGLWQFVIAICLIAFVLFGYNFIS